MYLCDYSFMYVCMYVPMYVSMYVCMYVCMILGCSGDLASWLSNGPFGTYSGLLWGLIWDNKWTY